MVDMAAGGPAGWDMVFDGGDVFGMPSKWLSEVSLLFGMGTINALPKQHRQ